jgi:hypothetical protein
VEENDQPWARLCAGDHTRSRLPEAALLRRASTAEPRTRTARKTTCPVRKAFGPGRHVSPHTLRHTWASLHLARGSNLKWVQEAGGWASAKVVLDVYGHFMPAETRGFADRIAAPDGPSHARVARDEGAAGPEDRDSARETGEPTGGLEPPTC